MTARLGLLRRGLNRLAVERDLRRWRASLAPLRAAARPDANRTVLFCDLMTMPTSAKVEALMAGLLRIKGYRPVVLLENPNRPIEDIFRDAVPEAEFIYLESGLTPPRWKRRAEAEAILARTPKLQDLVKLEIGGYRIGRNMQSLVLRRFRVGRLDDADPQHRQATRVR